MKRKIICILVCAAFLSIAVTVPANSIKTTKSTTPDDDDIKYLEIAVFKEENEELVPVHRAEVFVYRYPGIIPQYGLTFTDGYLLFQPTVRVGDDIKITAYHEWFGGNTIIINIGEEDPEVIHYDIVLDPEKSTNKNGLEASRLSFLMQRVITLFNFIKLR